CEPLTPHALGARFSGHARIAADGKTRADLELTGDGLEIQATARLFAGERSRIKVKSARVHGAALALLLREAGSDPVELRAARFAIALTGAIGLGAPLLHTLGAPESIRTASGAIALESLRVELPAPADGHTRYAVRGHLAGGSAQIESEKVAETLSGIDLRLA